MDTYSLRFAADTPLGHRTIIFSSTSTAHALEVARHSAIGRRAELYRDNDLVCRMQLVESTGVWRLEYPEPASVAVDEVRLTA